MLVYKRDKVELITGSIVVLIVFYLGVFGIHQTIFIDVDKIIHIGGFSYAVNISELREDADSTEFPEKSNVRLFENGNDVGRPHVEHGMILKSGKGRFSHWGESLLFSSSDSTDPRKNKREYKIVKRLNISWFLLVGWVIAGLLLQSYIISFIRYYREFFIVLASTILTFVLFAAIGEFYFRITTPFDTKKWPVIFDENVGYKFKPNSQVWHTNHLDFWVKEKSNSLGFLDVESPKYKKDGCHISFIGDSFIEAAQVKISDKVQRVFERKGRIEHPDWNLYTTAFGYSGTGQLNQLPFYEYHARKLKNNLIVLVFVSNDIANNSAILESLRNGWNPNSTPRVFAKRGVDGRLVLAEIDIDWQEDLPEAIDTDKASFHFYLKSKSYFYKWIYLSAYGLIPFIQKFEFPLYSDQIKYRAQQFLENPEVAKKMQGWSDDFANDIDKLIYRRKLPEIYSKANVFTEFALKEWKRRADNDGAKIVILLTSGFTLGAANLTDESSEELNVVAKAKKNAKYAKKRIQDMADEFNIPLLDQFEYIVKIGGDPLKASFKHDGHWTVQGHQWASDVIWEYLDEHKDICLK